jgi:hypothetical protein
MTVFLTKTNYLDALTLAIGLFKKHADENTELADHFRDGRLGMLLSPATIDHLEKRHREFANSFEQGTTLMREALAKERAALKIN